ncbi:MAG TPA: hypothetical protein VGK89_02630 [Candidatus Eisenbacteria bacterium]|jgi:hypothetical protein
MTNKRSVVVFGVLIVAAVVGILVMRGVIPPKTGTEGAIGAAQRYQSNQISEKDVQVTDSQVQAFLQSDTFRKLAKDRSFREAARSDAFGRFVGSDKLRDASARYDVAKVIQDAYVADLIRNDVFQKAMTTEALRDAMLKADLSRLTESGRLVNLLKSDALRDLAARAEFIQFADAAAKAEAHNLTDLARVDGYKTLKDTDSFRALISNQYFADALNGGLMNLFRSTEVAAFTTEGLRSLAEASHLGEALRVDGFRSIMEGLNADTYMAVRDLMKSPEALSVLSDAAYKDAAMHAELSKVAEAGFQTELAKVPE